MDHQRSLIVISTVWCFSGGGHLLPERFGNELPTKQLWGRICFPRVEVVSGPSVTKRLTARRRHLQTTADDLFDFDGFARSVAVERSENVAVQKRCS